MRVLLIPEDLSVERVRHRVLAGGHSVSEDKIRERHRRLWDLAARAIESCDSATVYDNSRRRGPRIAAQFTGGEPIGAPAWPAWTPAPLPQHWPS